MIQIYLFLRLQLLIFFRYLSRHRLGISLGLGGLLFVSFVIFKFEALSLRPNTLSEGIVGTYQRHDLPEIATRLMSQGLVEIDKSGRTVPKLADSWQSNSEATQFDFKLKNNLRWVDSLPVKSQDIEFSIPDVGISYPDEQTIRFKLKDSYSAFPSLLVKPIFKKGTLIGTGPYKVQKIETSRIFITKITLSTKDLTLPRISIRFYPNEKTAITAFILGEVQSLLGTTNSSMFKGSPLVKLHQTTSFNKIVTVLYNTKDPLLSNRSLRQALGFSIPEIENDTLAKTSIPPYSWAYFEDVHDYLSNLEEAEAALKRAKSAASNDLLSKELVLTSTPQYEEIGKKIVSSWQKLGLKAILRIESGIPQNFQALLIAQSIPSDPDQYSLWHSTQKTNLTKYDSKRADKDLEDGRKLLDEKDRSQKYFDFQKVLSEDSPATFLFFPKYNTIYLKKIERLINKILPLQITN